MVEHTIRRSEIYEDVIHLFTDEHVVLEYPLQIRYQGERAVDEGGVSRDMLSGFWEASYAKLFDGFMLLTPVLHPNTDMHVLPTIGRILSCGYLMCNFIPVRIALPTLICLLLGPTAAVPENYLLETFPDCLSDHEREILKEAIGCSSQFSENMKTKVIGVLSKFGCREVPTRTNIKDVIVKVAKYEFVVKPLAAICEIHSGIPPEHVSFWKTQSVSHLRQLYFAMAATPAKVLGILQSEPSNPCEERVMSYLEQFVGGMGGDMLRRFLRFVTGSSVCFREEIGVVFNGLSGIARRPIGHTCGGTLELSSSYNTFPEFVSEFEQILSQPESCWTMDAL